MNKQKIFIKKVELIDFESHRHTILDNFSDGFNVITANSDVGKTSILRALKLCAYNQFSPESVRLGAQFCDVTITSNIGYVNVKRGKGTNLWIVKRNESPTPMIFDKVGRNEVKEACEVIGMKMIQLGDMCIPVNIMNQLEGHFLIDSIGEEKTSGSVRAQIIDEICGLNGAEELIKNISLDQYRLTRKITESEEKIKILQAQLHSESEIKRDEEILASINQLEENIVVCNNNKNYIDGMLISYGELVKQMETVRNKISLLPDFDTALELSKSSFALIPKLSVLDATMTDYNMVSIMLRDNKNKQSVLPNIDISTDEWKEWIRKLETYNGFLSDFKKGHDRLKEIQNRLNEIGKSDVSDLLEKAKEKTEKLMVYNELIKINYELVSEIDRIRKELKHKYSDIKIIEQEISDIYKTIDVCPVTNLPITDRCSLKFEKGKI